jgi:hypothetical protein
MTDFEKIQEILSKQWEERKFPDIPNFPFIGEDGKMYIKFKTRKYT